MNDLLTSTDFIRIGHTGGLYGLEGGVRLGIEPGYGKILQKESAFVYFVRNGMFVPYFIRSWDDEQGVVNFERIFQREDGIVLTDQDVFARRSSLVHADQQSIISTPEFSLLETYKIWNIDKDDLSGSIIDVHEFPGGWMAEVGHPDKQETFLIPLAEQLIDRIDEQERVIYMHLPEGLEEL